MTPTLCSIPDAARSLGVSQERVRQYVREGRLAADRVGPVYVIRADAVKGFERRAPGRPRKYGTAVAQEAGTGRVGCVAVPTATVPVVWSDWTRTSTAKRCPGPKWHRVYGVTEREAAAWAKSVKAYKANLARRVKLAGPLVYPAGWA